MPSSVGKAIMVIVFRLSVVAPCCIGKIKELFVSKNISLGNVVLRISVQINTFKMKLID